MERPIIDWSTLKTEKSFADVLNSIINWSELLDPTKEEDLNSCADLLHEFIRKTPPLYDDLIQIASRAHHRIIDGQIDWYINQIASSKTELNRHIATISDIAEDAKASAEALSLTKLLNALEKAKTFIEAAQKVQKDLEDPDKEFQDKLESLLTGFGEVIKTIEDKTG